MNMDSASFSAAAPSIVADFAALTPDRVIDAVETSLGLACTSVCRPLNSYINRVYEVRLADDTFVIAKFYRPGRWNADALQDELDFLRELQEAEIPVVPPLASADGTVLHDWNGTRFAVFPRKGGRPLDEPSRAEWIQLGRLIARMHAVGARHAPRNRILMHPLHATTAHRDYILDSGTLSPELRPVYARTVDAIIADIAPLFDNTEALRIHGDLHFGNILFRPGEGFHLLDFDDMATGPAIQDIWMILPDRLDRAHAELDLILEGYEMFLEFPWHTVRLIEPLRAMRFIHFTAWCVRQKEDGGFSRLAPDWGSREFWRQEIADLERQHQEIRDSQAPRY